MFNKHRVIGLFCAVLMFGSVVVPITASAAIAFDAGAFNSGYGTSVSVPLDVGSGANRVVYACIEDVDNTLTGVSKGSGNFTQVGSTLNVGGGYTSLWRLIAPSTGSSEQVVATRTTSSQIMKVAVASYTGVSQSTQPGNYDSTIVNTATVSMSLTPAIANSWVAMCAHGNGSPDQENPGSGITRRTPQENTAILDNGAAVSGATTVSTTNPNPDVHGAYIFSIPPAAESGSAPVITSATTASGVASSSFSYTITATNSPTSFNATGLPTGLSIATSTGVISGTPIATSTSSVTLTASNAYGTGTSTLALSIGAPGGYSVTITINGQTYSGTLYLEN